MKRLIWLPLAGFLVIAGAAVAAASPGLADTAKGLFGADQAEGASASPSASSSPSTGSGTGSKHGRAFGFGFVNGDGESLLDQVLADLVTAGTITQAQSDAITQGLQTAADEKQAELEAQRQQMEQMLTQIQGFLEDGVITSDEIAQLPADNPFSNLQEILADGQITQEELQSIGFDHFFFGGPGGPGHFGPGGPGFHMDFDDDSGAESTPSPSTAPSSNS
jgi:polyhydroxyalkanoate synthesis regulator phasin